MNSAAIVSYFYGNSFSEIYKTSILSYRKHNPDLSVYIFGVNEVSDEVYDFCVSNGINFIELGHVADLRNQTITRLKRFTSSITDLVDSNFVIFTDLDICCTKPLPLKEMNFDKFNICPDRLGMLDPHRWYLNTKHRFNGRYNFQPTMTYYNSGFIAFDKTLFSSEMDSLYELCCNDFYGVLVKDISCYDQEYINLFTSLNPDKVNDLHVRWNYLIMTKEDYIGLGNTDVINVHFLAGNRLREEMIVAEASGNRIDYITPKVIAAMDFRPRSRLHAATFHSSQEKR